MCVKAYRMECDITWGLYCYVQTWDTSSIRCRVSGLTAHRISIQPFYYFWILPRGFFEIIFVGMWIIKKIVLLRWNHLQEKTNIQSTAQTTTIGIPPSSRSKTFAFFMRIYTVAEGTRHVCNACQSVYDCSCAISLSRAPSNFPGFSWLINK